jgi:hypothetical protein
MFSQYMVDNLILSLTFQVFFFFALTCEHKTTYTEAQEIHIK